MWLELVTGAGVAILKRDAVFWASSWWVVGMLAVSSESSLSRSFEVSESMRKRTMAWGWTDTKEFSELLVAAIGTTALKFRDSCLGHVMLPIDTTSSTLQTSLHILHQCNIASKNKYQHTSISVYWEECRATFSRAEHLGQNPDPWRRIKVRSHPGHFSGVIPNPQQPHSVYWSVFILSRPYILISACQWGRWWYTQHCTSRRHLLAILVVDAPL